MSFKETELGRIPVEWDIDTMENSLDSIIDYRGKTPKKTDEGIKTLSAKSVKDGYIDYDIAYQISSETYKNFMVRGIPKKGDILMTTEAPLGLVAKLDRDGVAIAQRLLTLRGKSNYLENNYLMYYLKSKIGQHQLNVRASGTTVSGIKQSEFRKVLITLPPIGEQKAISIILSDLDSKIEVNNQISEKLEEMAKAIFKQWFVDFEFPNEDGEPYKSSAGEMVESEMGMIPKGWSVKALDEIAEYLNGLAMQKYRPNETESGLPVLKIKELRQGRADEISDLCSNEIAEQYIINDGDLIFSWSGSLLVDIWCGGKCGLNQHLFKVTSSKYEKWFYNYWTKHHLDKFIRIAEGKATTMGHIKRGDLANSLTVIPDKKVYDKANAILKPLLDRMIKARIESRKLEEIRDILLPKLMSGEIRVPIELNEK